MYGTIMLGIATVARYSLSSAAAGITPAAAAAAIAADRLLLRDEPIAAAAVHYLDGTWTASTEGDVEAGTAADTINATVPGDIISDLFAAVRLSVCLSLSIAPALTWALTLQGRIGNPLFENNFKNHSLWTQDWSYTSDFALPDDWTPTAIDAATPSAGTGGSASSASSASEVLLVFESVKMGATVSLNGKPIGTLNDQFRRYIFPVSAADLKPTGNRITVSFASSLTCSGRWMACTGGWDWAPYSDTMQEGATTFSKGIVKSVCKQTFSFFRDANQPGWSG
jgi:beta-mannosidase